MTGASDSDVRDSLRQFSEIYNLVEQNYAEPVNPDKAIYNGAIPGMLHVLDPHSNFFDPKSYSLLREEQSGKYYGVGMQIAPRNNKIIVVAPFAGTPWNPQSGVSIAFVLTFSPWMFLFLFIAPLLANLAVRQLRLPLIVELWGAF